MIKRNQRVRWSVQLSIVFSLGLLALYYQNAASPPVSPGANPILDTVLPVILAARPVVAQDSTGQNLTITYNLALAPGAQTLLIDDAPTFNAPIVNQSVSGGSVSLPSLSAGLLPGVKYYLRISPANLNTFFTISGGPTWANLLPTSTYLIDGWANIGRPWLSSYTGVDYTCNSASHQCVWNSLDAAWSASAAAMPPATYSNGYNSDGSPKGPFLYVGSDAYTAEFALRQGVNIALLHRDLNLVDELSSFFVMYYQRFTTKQNMYNLGVQYGYNVSALLGNNSSLQNGSARILPFISGQTSTKRGSVSENILSTAQFLQPAARLLRIISTLQSFERTPAMLSFASLYAAPQAPSNTALLIDDHLIRLMFKESNPVPFYGYPSTDVPLTGSLVNAWDFIAAKKYNTTLPSYYHGLFDINLWLVGAAAEILGAHANDPNLVPLNATQLSNLQHGVSSGVNAFISKQATAQVKNFAGATVTAAAYFKGDFTDHPDDTYAGYSTVKYDSKGNGLVPTSVPSPTPTGVYYQAPPAKVSSIGWDISHYYRVPVFLRSLFDNRKVISALTASGFPKASDIQNAANQYVYVALQAATYSGVPLFNNYADGTNGWFRVGYGGNPLMGYPPSGSCQARESETASSPMYQKFFCFVPGSTMGWGLLAPFNSDLLSLQQKFVSLAVNYKLNTPALDQFYYYDSKTFSFWSSDATPVLQYPFLLFNFVAENAQQF